MCRTSLNFLKVKHITKTKEEISNTQQTNSHSSELHNTIEHNYFLNKQNKCEQYIQFAYICLIVPIVFNTFFLRGNENKQGNEESN